MKIYDLLNEIMGEIDDSRKSLFGNKKTIDVDFVLEILEEIRDALPEEIVYAQEVLKRKKEIIDQAEQKAKDILDGVDNLSLIHILRSNTRISHSRGVVEIGERTEVPVKPYEKNIQKYVMMPGMAKKRHVVVEQRMKDIADVYKRQEYLRDKTGQNVLLFIDNIYRFIQAGSEVSALLGRIPSAVGYQPTLANELGALEERITSTKHGSITSVQAIYVPADDLTDPAPATTFTHLDAITVLSRSVSELGIYPAVDPLESTSRILDPRIVGEEHYDVASREMCIRDRFRPVPNDDEAVPRRALGKKRI